MKVTLDYLRRAVAKTRDSVLNSLDRQTHGQLPWNGRFGKRFQYDLICRTLHELVRQHGPLRLYHITIGVTPSSGRNYGLRAVPNELDQLLDRLWEEEMSGFEQSVIERWKAIKIARGELHDESQLTDAERFLRQKFTGFD